MPATEPLTVDSALRDARLIAAYAVRHGRLPPSSKLLAEIDAAAQARDRGEDPPIAALVAETQKAGHAAHMSIDRLSRHDALPARISRSASAMTPYLLGILTLLLTFYLAFQSSELHSANLALREHQELVSERLNEKIYQAWKMTRYERVLNVQGPPLAQLDSYQRLVADVQRLYEKRLAVQGLLIDAAHINYLPPFLRIRAPVDPALQEFKSVEESVCPPEFEWSPLPAASAGSAASADARDLGALAPDLRINDCFVRGLKLDADSLYYPMTDLTYAARNKVNLLVSWLLPGLYGLLGACVYLMRDLLSRGSQGHSVRHIGVVDQISLLLRVALGGLAGIIVGWFWVPAGIGPEAVAIPVSSLSFGVAFLAGFSIDSLFALLDRLIKNFRGDGDGEPAKSGPRKTGQR